MERVFGAMLSYMPIAATASVDVYHPYGRDLDVAIGNAIWL